MKRHYCTYFDHRYLAQGLAMSRSLAAHDRDHLLWILCMDDEACSALEALALPTVRLVPLQALERWDGDLHKAKEGRSKLEYYFTCTAAWCRFVMAHAEPGAFVTYLDADLYLFSTPSTVFEEMAHSDILVVEHGFAPGWEHLLPTGRFNLGLSLIHI